MKTDEQVKSAIKSDYLYSAMTVQQIAAKYNVCLRTVYNLVDNCNRKGHENRIRRDIRLSKAEAEALLYAITKVQEDDALFPVVKSIEPRLLLIADELTML